MWTPKEEIGGGDASKVPEESRGQMDAVGSGSPSTYASRLCYPLDLQGVSVAVGERHDLTNDLDYRIPHRLNTETPVDIREQFTFDDACRVADGNELHGPPVLLPVDTVLDDHTGDADSFAVIVLEVDDGTVPVSTDVRKQCEWVIGHWESQNVLLGFQPLNQ
jgi:hypothetical protein